MNFTESKLEQALIDLLAEEGYTHVLGETIQRDSGEVLLKDDLRAFLSERYSEQGITHGEIESIILRLESLPASDLYGSNKAFMKMVSDGFNLKRENPAHKDFIVHLIDYSDDNKNICKIVNQLESDWL